MFLDDVTLVVVFRQRHAAHAHPHADRSAGMDLDSHADSDGNRPACLDFYADGVVLDAYSSLLDADAVVLDTDTRLFDTDAVVLDAHARQWHAHTVVLDADIRADHAHGAALTVTPWPSNCIDVVKNGRFDHGFSGWFPSDNLLPVRLVGAPVLSPPNALQLGTQTQQINSYSSVRQYVTIPPGTTATLQFWTWTWAQPNPGADRQEAILLAPDNSVLAVLWRTETSEQVWRQVAINLSAYARPFRGDLLQRLQRWRRRADQHVPRQRATAGLRRLWPTARPGDGAAADHRRHADRPAGAADVAGCADSAPSAPIADIARDFQPRRASTRCRRCRVSRSK